MPDIVRSDPDVLYIEVDTSEEPSDAVVTEALEQIPSDDGIDPNQMEILVPIAGDWPLFFAHVATRENLEKVELFGRLTDQPSDAGTQSILRAIQQNSATRKIEFQGLCPPVATVVWFLDAANHLTEFSLRATMEEHEADGPAVLAAAIQRHPNLEDLCLVLHQEAYMFAILTVLHTNKVVQKLRLRMGYYYRTTNWSEETIRTFQKFMRSTTTLRELCVTVHPKGHGFGTKQDLMQIAKTNFSLHSLTVEGAEGFFNEEEQGLLQSYFRRNRIAELFLRNPTTIPKKLLAQTIGVVAQGWNPSILFQSIRAAASVDLFGEQQLTRKRKRPAYFKPT